MVELISACVGFLASVVAIALLAIALLIRHQDRKLKRQTTEDERKLEMWYSGPTIAHKEDGTIFLDSAHVSKELRDALARRRKG